MKFDFYRHIQSDLAKPVEAHTNKVLILLGARRTGKTYILEKIKSQNKTALYNRKIES